VEVTYGSLFAGIGGFDLGFERAGLTCKWQVEIDPFCRRVLAKHWPHVERFEDVRTVGAHNLPPVDVLCGGFPCQDISNAGKRVGIDGERSGLWSEFARLIGELRPRYVVVENVAGLLIRGMGRVCGDLAAFGYDAEWDVVSACALGAPHARERVFIVAHPQGQRQGQLRRRWSQEERESTRHLHWPTTEPGYPRVVDGISDRVDRLRGLGNAIVVPVAELIGRRLMATRDLDVLSGDAGTAATDLDAPSVSEGS
jgi:DNA (cytosine-5)-methyltransferase 1